MDMTTAVPTESLAQALTFDKLMTVRERLGECLAALVEKEGATQPVDPELPRDLRAAAPLLSAEEIGMAADAMIGVALHHGYLQPAPRPHDVPGAGYLRARHFAFLHMASHARHGKPSGSQALRWLRIPRLRGRVVGKVAPVTIERRAIYESEREQRAL